MRPIFIGGTGRSGTTVLKRALLEVESVVALPHEARFIVDPHGVLALRRALRDHWSPYDVDTAIHEFRKQARRLSSASWVSARVLAVLRRMGIALPPYAQLNLARHLPGGAMDAALEQLESTLGVSEARGSWIGSPGPRLRGTIRSVASTSPQEVDQALRDYVAAVFAARAEQMGRPSQHRVLDDTPYSICHARELIALFPGAHIVHAMRDPRDVVSSYQTRVWGGGTPAQVAARVDCLYRRWTSQKASLSADQYTEIALEDLVASPSEVLVALFERLDLGTPPEVIEAAGRHYSTGAANMGRGGALDREYPALAQRLDFAVAEFTARGQ